jgi:hypothetical protein
MTDEEYGHHPLGYDPRGPDFDAPHTPEREARMAEKAKVELDELCPVCGNVHAPAGPHSPE